VEKTPFPLWSAASVGETWDDTQRVSLRLDCHLVDDSGSFPKINDACAAGNPSLYILKIIFLLSSTPSDTVHPSFTRTHHELPLPSQKGDVWLPGDNVIAPPLSNRFPAYPATWYLFGEAKQLKRGPLSKTMLGRRLVGFRTESGQVAILDGFCSHLGADLGRGCVVGEHIRCPFHGWEYGADGACRHLPGQKQIPNFARQRSYPVVERHGFVYFFNGAEALFPLPFFFGEDPARFVPARPFSFIGACTWYMLAANGFDIEHFRCVHDRELIGEAHVDSPHPFARRMNYRARVTGNSLPDRLIRCFLGHEVQVTITSWAGPLFFITGTFARARSTIMLCSQPWTQDTTFVETIVFAPRVEGLLQPLLRPLSLWVRRWLSECFLADDVQRLGGIRYSPYSLVAADHELIAYFDWLVKLPQRVDAATTSSDNFSCVSPLRDLARTNL